jgi:hypothetical protein
MLGKEGRKGEEKEGRRKEGSKEGEYENELSTESTQRK